MNTTTDPRWIAVKPSTTNLMLTLASAVLACGALWLIDIADWARAIILILALVVLTCDVYIVRFKSKEAIGAFYLFEREVPVPMLVPETPSDAMRVEKQLWVRIRYLNAAKRGAIDNNEVDALVHRSPYVSTYFSTIPYQLPNDPKWRRWLPRVISLWADSLDRDDFRQVRVRLKWRAE